MSVWTIFFGEEDIIKVENFFVVVWWSLTLKKDSVMEQNFLLKQSNLTIFVTLPDFVTNWWSCKSQKL